MDCPTCYAQIILECFDTLLFDVGLDAATEYSWFFKDKHGNVYWGKSTTDGDGILEIDAADLPDGYLNHAAGAFEFTIKLNYGDCDVVALVICGAEETVNCIQLTAQKQATAETEETVVEIPCCPEEEEVP